MSEERKQILEMLSSGKVTIEEAEKLLDAINDNLKNNLTENNSFPFFMTVFPILLLFHIFKNKCVYLLRSFLSY